MNWRLQEGQGEALYEIGVEDCGTLSGVNSEELEASLTTLKKMADRLGASITILYERKLENDRHIVEVLVRKVPDDQHFIDLRVAVLGTVDSGKSSLVGVCTHGELDNGRGRARLNLFRHLHEIQTGRTSSITHEILGFNNLGEVIYKITCFLQLISFDLISVLIMVVVEQQMKFVIDQPKVNKFFMSYLYILLICF
jgi:GTPase